MNDVKTTNGGQGDEEPCGVELRTTALNSTDEPPTEDVLRDAFIQAIDGVTKKTIVAQALLSHALDTAGREYLSDRNFTGNIHAINDALVLVQKRILDLKLRQATRLRLK